MKKVLIITSGFLPGKKYGGPTISIDNFCTLMRDEYEFFVICTNHDFLDKTPYPNIGVGWNDRGNCKVKYFPDNEFNSSTFENTIHEIRPDIIYLNSFFELKTFSIIRLAKKFNIKVVLAPRGQLCGGALKLKSVKKRLFLFVFNLLNLKNNIVFQSTSDEETSAIISNLKVKSKDIYFLNNVPSIPQIEYSRNIKEKGSLNLVFISRIHPKKNLFTAIQLLSTIKGKINFDIYGPIEDEEYWKKCLNYIETLPNNVSINYKGLISHEQIHETFSKYDCFLFPTLSENYGHVIAEALFVGTPVIISDQTPWNDIDKIGGFVASLGDESSFHKALAVMLDMTDDEYKILSEGAKKIVFQKTDLDQLKKAYMRAF